MPKRKRNEPSLDERLDKWKKELARGLKLAKGFERQRMSKRIRDADQAKKERLEREILVLKCLHIQQVAVAVLCSSLLKIKGVAESPKLPAQLKPVPKPDLPEEEKIALHNVTSALCNRKQVKDIIDEAVMGTCIALRVPMPEKRNKAKTMDTSAKTTKTQQKPKDDEEDSIDGPSDDEDESEFEGFDGPPLLKRKTGREEDDEEDLESATSSASSQDEDFEFENSGDEERLFSKYDGLVGGFSDEDEDENEENESDEAHSRSKMVRRADNDISLSPESASESDESEDNAISPPAKKTKIKAAMSASYTPGNSAFLPSLMGGYISGSESEASDIDVAPPTRKNRRGQRARQAIWEKKYGDKAKHYEKQKDSRNSGWDMKRGAVDTDGDASTPWKKGIKNPFEQGHIHPERQRHVQGNNREHRDRERHQPRSQGRNESRPDERHKPRPPPSRDDQGKLHPSWAAAKLAKEGGNKVEFKGKKVTF
ncbi:Bud-site selection protein, partial [Xylariaceae sp. FL0255]